MNMICYLECTYHHKFILGEGAYISRTESLKSSKIPQLAKIGTGQVDCEIDYVFARVNNGLHVLHGHVLYPCTPSSS